MAEGRGPVTHVANVPEQSRGPAPAGHPSFAKVWVASSLDLPGLNTEADTAEKLVEKLPRMIPDLLDGQPLRTL